MRPFPQSGLKSYFAQRLTLYSLLAGIVVCASGCAKVASIPAPPVGPQAISVTVTPSSGLVMLGNQFVFAAAVKNSSDSTVTWSVNGVAGGGALTGTITADGVYTAPSDLPIPANLTVTATSHADISKSGTAVITVQSDVSIGLPSGGAARARCRLNSVQRTRFWRWSVVGRIQTNPCSGACRAWRVHYCVDRWTPAVITQRHKFCLDRRM
jgi:hypothetical protein